MSNTKTKTKRKGFTLIELLIVVIIIGVVAAIALPMYFTATEKTRASESLHLLGTIAKAEQRHKLQSQAYTTDIKELDVTLTDFSTGDAATGNGFDSEYFEFELGAESASALRKGSGDYTLGINYTTNELTCTPASNRICRTLRLSASETNSSEADEWQPCGESELSFAVNDNGCGVPSSCRQKTISGGRILMYCEDDAEYIGDGLSSYYVFDGEPSWDNVVWDESFSCDERYEDSVFGTHTMRIDDMGYTFSAVCAYDNYTAPNTCSSYLYYGKENNEGTYVYMKCTEGICSFYGDSSQLIETCSANEQGNNCATPTELSSRFID